MGPDASLLENTLSRPRELGPYRIQRVLGTGGMGIVYLAHHRDTQEPVALKTVRVTRDRLFASIRWEAQALGRIHHPGVIRIFGHGVSGGQPWYAMELMAGRTLQQLIAKHWSIDGQTSQARGPSRRSQEHPHKGPEQDSAPPERLPALHLLERVRSLCAPLAYLHGCGLVHRDIKPGNVFIRKNGTVVLGDFGVAGAFGGASGREELQVDEGGQGTLLYMAPEEIQGDLVDARADLYSLGCVLYECVTGFPPFFGGTSGSLRRRHLHQRPTPPSELLDESLPGRLEWLILKLLEKRPQDRLGFAEDVDRVLAEVGVESVEPAQQPRPRPYLYRPPFSGRADAMQRMGARLDALALGHGGCIFIGGGSGAGKTRLAMEMARGALSRNLSVVTGECIQRGLSSSQVDAGPRASPLHPFRPLLARVADWCRVRGEEETAWLLGPRGKVLVSYEPALGQLPGMQEQPPPPRLASDEAERARIFTSLQEVIFSWSEEEPLLLILDDLQWADELTLGFLRQLRHEELAARGVLLVGTYRMEEMREPLREVVSRATEALHLELGRLDEPDIRSMVCGMLALRELPPDFDGLVRQSEGNPFFVAEYLRAAITEGLLHRDASGQWRLDTGAWASLKALALPNSIAEIIHRRLRGLNARTQVLVQMAAVLGRDFDAELLLSSMPLSEAAGLEALETLRMRQILERVQGERLRFLHDKLREFSYAGLSTERRRKLHHRAAKALERHYAQAADFALMFPSLANHWAKAEVHDQASRYFGLAGDRARAAHANEEAIFFYQSALAEAWMHQGPDGDPSQEAGSRLGPLYESLGDVLALTGRQEEARAAYGEALSRISPEQRCQRAGLHRKEGKTWETRHLHEAALRAYDEAESALSTAPSWPNGASPGDEASCWWHEWVQVQVERIWVYYWMGRVEEMGAIIAKVQPHVEAHGTSRQRSGFFQSLLLRAFKRDRYVISEETLKHARKALEASEQSGDLADLAASHLYLSFCLLLHGDLLEAERVGLEGLQLAERLGDLTLQSRLVKYLMLVYRRRGQRAVARVWGERCLRLSAAARMEDYAGAAQATLAWVAWKEQRLEEAEHGARAALECWRKLSRRYPFTGQWQGLVLLMALEAQRGDVERAVERARAMLDPAQQRLPAPLDAALEEVLAAWDQGHREVTLDHLRHAVGIAEELGFL